MVELIGYICGSLKEHESKIRVINHIIRKQAKHNREVSFFIFAAIGGVVLSEINNYKRDKRIEKLSEELEELKRLKGE